ncbi:MAG: hypothetical protein ACKO9Z_07305 [Planctomycetota bacterium]
MRAKGWGLAALCAVLATTGCKNTAGTGTAPPPPSFPFSSSAPGAAAKTPGMGASTERDPLLGPAPNGSLPSRAPSPPPGATSSANWNTPPAASAAPASMTSGSGGLRIPGADNGNPAGGLSLPPIRLQQNGSSGFTPANPQPSPGLGAAPAAGAAGVAGAVTAASFNPGAPDSYASLQAELVRKGVVFQRLEMTNANDWRFTCTVADKQNPTLRRNFDHRGRTDIEVMRAVLDEIDAPPPGF